MRAQYGQYKTLNIGHKHTSGLFEQLKARETVTIHLDIAQTNDCHKKVLRVTVSVIFVLGSLKLINYSR